MAAVNFFPPGDFRYRQKSALQADGRISKRGWHGNNSAHLHAKEEDQCVVRAAWLEVIPGRTGFPPSSFRSVQLDIELIGKLSAEFFLAEMLVLGAGMLDL